MKLWLEDDEGRRLWIADEAGLRAAIWEETSEEYADSETALRGLIDGLDEAMNHLTVL